MLNITISGKTIAELIEAAKGFVAELGGGTSTKTKAAKAEPEEDESDKKAEKVRRAAGDSAVVTKASAKAAKEKEADGDDADDEPATSSEDVRKLLLELKDHEDGGRDAVFAVLGKFKKKDGEPVKLLSELAKSDYAAAHKAIQKELNSLDV